MQHKLLASIFISIFLSSILAGCSTLSKVTSVFTESSPAFLSVDEAKEQIAQAKTVDNIFSTNKIESVTKTSDKDYLFDINNADAYNFSTGKSFFRLFQLPLNTTYLSMQFNVSISTTTFLPRIDFYNKDKKLVSSLKPSAFKFRDSQLGNGFLVSKLIINNVSAKPGREFAYMVIYTTDEALNTKTPIINPLIKQAIALRNDIPSNAPDILIPHSPIGEMNIVFSFKEQEESLTENLISYLDEPLFGGDNGQSNRQQNVILATGEVYSVSSQSEGSTAVTSTDSSGKTYTPNDANAAFVADTNNQVINPVQTPNANNAQAPQAKMLPETEKFYNELITKAVAEGDISKAMNLVGEAQRAGSISAQQAFIEAVQRIKK